MLSIAADIRSMLTGPFSEPVTLSNGAIVSVNAATADVNDSLGGDGVIAGQTLVLSAASDDVASVKVRSLLTFRGQGYIVNSKQFRSQGYLTRLFLGAP